MTDKKLVVCFRIEDIETKPTKEATQLYSQLDKVLKAFESINSSHVNYIVTIFGYYVTIDKSNVPTESILLSIDHMIAIADSSPLDLRIAITEGDLKEVEDVNGAINFIGKPLNDASRIVFSKIDKDKPQQELMCYPSKKNHLYLHKGALSEFDGYENLSSLKGVSKPLAGKHWSADDPEEEYVCLSRELKRTKQPLVSESHKNIESDDCYMLTYDLKGFSASKTMEQENRFIGARDKILETLNRFGIRPSEIEQLSGGDGGTIVFPKKHSLVDKVTHYCADVRRKAIKRIADTLDDKGIKNRLVHYFAEGAKAPRLRKTEGIDARTIHELASNLWQALAEDTRFFRSPNATITCRIAIHYGPKALVKSPSGQSVPIGKGIQELNRLVDHPMVRARQGLAISNKIYTDLRQGNLQIADKLFERLQFESIEFYIDKATIHPVLERDLREARLYATKHDRPNGKSHAYKSPHGEAKEIVSEKVRNLFWRSRALYPELEERIYRNAELCSDDFRIVTIGSKVTGEESFNVLEGDGDRINRDENEFKEEYLLMLDELLSNDAPSIICFNEHTQPSGNDFLEGVSKKLKGHDSTVITGSSLQAEDYQLAYIMSDGIESHKHAKLVSVNYTLEKHIRTPDRRNLRIYSETRNLPTEKLPEELGVKFQGDKDSIDATRKVDFRFAILQGKEILDPGLFCQLAIHNSTPLPLRDKGDLDEDLQNKRQNRPQNAVHLILVLNFNNDSRDKIIEASQDLSMFCQCIVLIVGDTQGKPPCYLCGEPISPDSVDETLGDLYSVTKLDTPHSYSHNFKLNKTLNTLTNIHEIDFPIIRDIKYFFKRG